MLSVPHIVEIRFKQWPENLNQEATNKRVIKNQNKSQGYNKTTKVMSKEKECRQNFAIKDLACLHLPTHKIDPKIKKWHVGLFCWSSNDQM